MTVAPVMPMPFQMVVPPDVVTPDFTVGCDEALTTRPLPPDDGVLKAMTSEPLVSEYHVFLLHDDDL